MNISSQADAIDQLSVLAEADTHSVLIAGVSGCGKTYLARKYATLLSISDFYVVDAKVADLRQIMESSAELRNPIVVCIENLDKGAQGASFTILKFLEEPKKNVYVVVTCCNIRMVPDTILSRCACIDVLSPSYQDLLDYCKAVHLDKFASIYDSDIKLCIDSFADIDYLSTLTDIQMNYISELSNIIPFSGPVSNVVWKLTHFSDNTDIRRNIGIRYVFRKWNTLHVTKAALQCLQDIDERRVAAHAAVTAFVFKCKYIK